MKFKMLYTGFSFPGNCWFLFKARNSFVPPWSMRRTIKAFFQLWFTGRC